MTQRRPVRVDPQFFTDLDAQLRSARGPNGEPSATDFLLIDLPSMADAFVRAAVIVGQLVPDGCVVLFGIDIDAS